MSNKFTIKIKKCTQAEVCMGILLIMPFAFGALIQILHMPNAIKYVCDVAYLFLCLLMLLLEREEGITLNSEFSWVLLFFAFTLLTYLVQFQSPLYYLWGFRNNFRFYIAFFAFIIFLKRQHIEEAWCVFDLLFWVSFVVSIFQFFYLGINQDYLGGIFGTGVGCNGYSAVFMTIIVIKSVVFFLQKKERALICFCKCAASLVVAALAELKFFFIAFLLIVFLAMCYTRFSWRKIIITILAIIGVFAGAMFLGRLFPVFEGWFTLDRILDTITNQRGYTSSGDLNRLHFFAPINDMWLRTWGQRLFGLGLGNCDTSSFSFLNTPFFEKFGDMHYSWMSHAFMYLECGLIGLIFYFGFFALVYFDIRKIEKNFTGEEKMYCHIARIFAVLCVIISIYNSSLRTEAGYMAYFVLAVPFVLERERLRKNSYD